MKKLIALLLVAMMCLSLAACDRNDIENKTYIALQGTWVATWEIKGNDLSRYFTFQGEKYTTGGVAIFGKIEPETGFFEVNVSDSIITFMPDDGSETYKRKYTYNRKSGEITLWWSAEIQFKKVT